MALLDSEIQRIKAELGYNVMTVGAEPYIGVTQLFAQVIQPYTQSGASTTSTTSVAAASSPTQRTIVVASATGVHAGDRAIVDVDSRQEAATVEAVSGTSVTLLLSLSHSGTYPVTIEGGESLIREYLGQCIALGRALMGATTAAGVKRVDEVEFFAPTATGLDAQSSSLIQQREMWRRELADLLGIPYLRDARGSAGQTSVVW